jgi:hypothetical protein
MQFIKNSSSRKSVLSIVIKLCFVILIFFGIIFFINKIDFPAPKKVIEKVITNENFKIVK